MKFIKKLLKSEVGSIVSMVIAVLVSMVSIISSVSLMNLVNAAHIDTQYAHDKLQEEFLLRSEARRTHLAIEHNDIAPLPPRIVEIIEPQRITTYYITNNKKNISITFFMGFTTEQAIAIQSLITAKRARKLTLSYKSPVKRYSERVIRNKSLAEYQYFTHTEESENADGGDEAARVKFWGPDILYGPVHSNTDIWIQNGGGGINGGWPTFYDMVTTAGIFRNYNQNGAPLSEGLKLQIFLGGWLEGPDGANPIIFEPTAELIRANGIPLGGPDTDIVYVNITGSNFDCWYGNIEETEVDTFSVYSWFPHNTATANAVINAGGNWYEDSNYICTNHITMYDTLWTPGPSFTVSNRSVWVENAQLWIKGDVYGKQTWGCADTIFIVGDITYANTWPGNPPDDPENLNTTDYFGLVSEQKILIRYKHRDPETNEIMFTNCNNIMLYGAYAAIGEGDVSLYGEMACHYDGIFTFQYHHPHGSTPSFWAQSPYTLQETLYTFVDFHKFIFPINPFVPPNIDGFNLHGAAIPMGYPCCGFPYESPGYLASYPNNNSSSYVFPYGTDYPWYNPVWPESSEDIVFERGTITIYGAIAQRRRGFVHRSGGDDYNHPQGGSSPSPWEMDDYHYDGDHNSTGYSKDYHFDERFIFIQPPDYPQVYEGWGESQLTAFTKQSWSFKSPPTD
ncbi:MAG: hypothetical protein KAW88_07475 [Candidatus Cloacimonetes bacterium]|nr:hypothetical protein [Candidatus Cloacimonadota bacterium]